MNAKFWTPEPIWAGQSAIIIGGGPSLRAFDFEKLRGRNVLGCNDAVHLPQGILKFGVFGDAGWWHRSYKSWENKELMLVSNSPSLADVTDPNLHVMQRIRDGLHYGNTLGWNYSTGALAINLAIVLGASSIYLLGYDLSRPPEHSHWHDRNTNPPDRRVFLRFLKGFNVVKMHLPKGVEVFNVSDGSSRLDCFQTIDFQKFGEYLVSTGETV